MTQLYLAGVYTTGSYRKAVKWNIENGVIPPYILGSYYYLRKGSENRDGKIPYRDQIQDFILDSGAYTFMDEISGEPEKIDFQKYTDQYADFINTYDIELFVELDIDNVVGLHRVRELRRRLERKTGRDCIPIWHKSRGKEAFVRIAKNYDYIGIGGIVAGEFSEEEYKYFNWLTETAHKHGAEIHGMGFTPSNIGKYGFDSVDSTSWLMAQKYGTVHQFTGSGLEQISQEGRSKYPENTRHNFKEWVKYARYLDGQP